MTYFDGRIWGKTSTTTSWTLVSLVTTQSPVCHPERSEGSPRFFGRGVYPEPYEILSVAKNDRSEGLSQNDIRVSSWFLC